MVFWCLKKCVCTHLFSLTSVHTNAHSCIERKGRSNGIVPLYCPWPDFWNVTEGEKSSHLHMAFTQIGIKAFILVVHSQKAIHFMKLHSFSDTTEVVHFFRRKMNYIYLVYHIIFKEFIFCWVVSHYVLWINCSTIPSVMLFTSFQL